MTEIIYEDNEVYHNEKDHISSTTIKKYSVSSKHAQIPFKETKSMFIGTAMHSIMEGSFDFEYHIGDKPDLRTNIGKCYEAIKNGLDIDKFKEKEKEKAMLIYEASNGKLILSEEEYKQVSSMADSIRGHSLYPGNDGMIEASVYGEIFGVKAKCRPDLWNIENSKIYDWKSISTNNSKTLSQNSLSAIYNYSYHASAWWYLKITVAKEFVLVFVESNEPYDVIYVKLTEEILEKGREICLKGIANYNRDPHGQLETFPDLIYV